MTTTATVSLGVQWTPPSAPTNSGNSSFTVVANHNAQNVGAIDIQPSDISGTIFVIPFGSVSGAKVAVIKNLMTTDIGIRINGAVADNFRLPSGGELAYAAQNAPGSNPLSSVSVITTASPTAIEQVIYFVFGD